MQDDKNKITSNRPQQGSTARSADYTKDNWSQVQKQARQRWNDLTESDLDRAEGSHDYLVSTVQRRCGLSRDQAEQQVVDFEKGFQGQGSSASSRTGSTSQSGR